jgi:trigger factor
MNSTEGLIKIRLTEGDYQPNVEEKVKDYARKANIKGFRQGKVPSGVIKKMYGKSILVDEINNLLTHKISDYIKEQNLKILGEPLPNQEKSRDIDWDTQKDFEFEYQIGMVDEFNYDLSSKVKVTSHPIDVDKAIIDETVNDLKKRFGKVNYPETSEVGDNLFGELTGANDFKREYAFIDTTKVEQKEQKKFAGLKKEDQVDFDIDKAFSDTAAISQLLEISEEEAKAAKGKYTLRVTNISRTEPAEVNVELFDRVFGKDAVTTEEDFLAKVTETISENYKRESEHFLDHNIEDYFINHTNISLPSDFLKTWLKSTSNGQITDSVLENEFNAYVRGLKWDLIKNKIADDNKIEVTADEVRAKAKEMILAQFGGQAFADQLGDRMDAIADNYLKNENGQNFMKIFNQLRHERILKFIKEKISVQEKKVTVEQFKKIVAEHKH